MSPGRDYLNMSSSESFKFPKLKGSNYSTWADHMQAALQAKYLWLLVKGTEPCPAEPPANKPEKQTAAEYKAEKDEHFRWLLRDDAAQGVIKGACEDSQLPHIKGCKSSKELWEALKKVHVTNQARINVHYFFEELYVRKYVDGTPMADHIAAMLDIKRQIEDTGEKLEDLHVARAMVLSLPKTQTWDIIKIQLFDIESSKLTSELVSTKLQAKANRRARDKASGNTALLAHGRGKRAGKSKGKGGKENGKGHEKPGPASTDECWYCHETGHWANKCPKREEDDRKKKQGQSANLTVSHLQDLGSREVGRVYMTIDGTPAKSDVLLDCAATSHMFHDRSGFQNYVPSTGDETVSVGDNHPLTVAGRGSVTFTT